MGEPTVARLLLEGRAGLFKDEKYLLGTGTAVVIGRSRSCDVSVTRTRAYKRIGGHVLNRSRSFLKMSRRHFQVNWDSQDTVRLRDLSTNGIKVDGHRVQEVVFTVEELRQRDVLIEFADGESFRLGLVGTQELDDLDGSEVLQESSSSSHRPR